MMDLFTDIQEIKKYANVSNRLDIQLLKPYIEEALRVKIEPYIPALVVEEILQGTDESLQQLLKKATANYAVAFAIPFLKVNFSNTGVNYYSDEKMEKSPWWDLRDLGLSSIAMADRSLNDAIEALLQSDQFKTKLPFLNTSFLLIRTVKEFEKFYSISSSWELFTKLQPLMEMIWESLILPQLGTCSADDLRPYPNIWKKLQCTAAFFTIAEAARTRSFSFTTNAIVLQWEELPWQKSKILTEPQIKPIADRMEKLAQYELGQVQALLIKENVSCYVPNNAQRKIIKLKSGIYF